LATPIALFPGLPPALMLVPPASASSKSEAFLFNGRAGDFPAHSIHPLSSFQSRNPKFGIVENIATEYSRATTSSGVKSGVPNCLASMFRSRGGRLNRVRLLGKTGGFLKLLGALVAPFPTLDDLANPFARDSKRRA
jgi:hypothetical protein